MSYKQHYSRALAAAPQRLHFAAHSHHLWPDVTRDAQLAYWDDSAHHADPKWDHIFGEVMSTARAHIARHLNLAHPSRIAFVPNTHGFVTRLFSCFAPDQPLRILTSDSEFHSFSRQTARLEEDGLARVERVPVLPCETFVARFCAAARRGGHDIVFISQVFFNSGFIVSDLEELVRSVPDERSYIVVDGYHGFLAVPSDLSALQDRVFYLAGGYKYAMAGEGCCFMHVPPGYGARPRDTGWLAAFGALAGAQTGVPYASDGGRFFGATFDPSGLYRLNAVFGLLDELQIDVAALRAHAHSLQKQFLALLGEGIGALKPDRLLIGDADKRGQFLTFRTEQAGAIHDLLLGANIITDHRADRLRFGFGLYQDEADVDQLITRIRATLAE